ncbi:MAG: hypothetical protein AAF696_21985 [Bacteroidota bacterium]
MTLEDLYFLHEYFYLEINYDKWLGNDYSYGGWKRGFFVLLLTTTPACLIYYILGRSITSLGSWKPWLRWLATTSILTAVVTGIVLSQSVFKEVLYLEGIATEVILFSLYNGVYAGILFTILSYFFRYLSIHARRVPFY